MEPSGFLDTLENFRFYKRWIAIEGNLFQGRHSFLGNESAKTEKLSAFVRFCQLAVLLLAFLNPAHPPGLSCAIPKHLSCAIPEHLSCAIPEHLSCAIPEPVEG